MVSINQLTLAVVYVGMTAFGLCFFARFIAPKFRLMDHPTPRKSHAEPTPLMGGIVVLVSIVPAVAVLVSFMDFRPGPDLLVAVGAICGLTILGIFDDQVDQSAVVRLAVAALIFVWVSIVADSVRLDEVELWQPRITFVLDRPWVRVSFTALCCVGLVNAINMADGKNGLVPGLVLGWLALLMTIAPAPLCQLMLVVAAGVAVLLYFNLRGQLFLGDGGAYGLATIVSLLAILVYNSPTTSGERIIGADWIALLFFVPVLDPFRLCYARVRAGVTPFTPGRDHLHHYLKDCFGWPAGLVIYWIIALLPASMKFLLGVNSVLLFLVGLVAYAGAIFLASRRLGANRMASGESGTAGATARSDAL